MSGRIRGHRRLFAVGTTLCLVSMGALLFAAPVLAATEEDVTRNHDADWHTRRGACSGVATGSQGFESGPVGPADGPNQSELPPRGTGSLRLTTGANGDSYEELRNTRYEGKPLADITELDYWTYVASAPPSLPGGYTPAAYLGLDIDITGDNRVDDTLIFEPAFQTGQDDVARGRWQRWFAHGAGGNWYRASSPGNVRSLEAWVTELPTAKIVNTGLDRGGVSVAAGCGDSDWAGFLGYVDAVTIGFRSDATSLAYDMDPPTANEARRLDCSPETAVNPTGSRHTVTCTVRNDQGFAVEDAWVAVEATGANDPDGTDSPQSPDFMCETLDNGTCSFSHGGAISGSSQAGRTIYRAWIDIDKEPLTAEADPTEGRNERTEPGARPETEEAPDDTDVVEKNWVATQLQCDPETGTAQTGAAHTIVCIARDSSGATVVGTPIDMEATGVNNPDNNTTLSSPDFSCTTDANGSCSMIHGPGGKGTTTSSGVTTYRAWIDADGSNSTAEADASEGRDEATSAGTRSEPDATEVIQVTWGSSGATPSPTPTTSPGACVTPGPSPSGSASPGASPSPSATPCPTPSPSATPTPTPSPTPTTEPHGCAGDPDAITGTPGDDVLRGTPGDDTICGRGGDDTIVGGGGDDLLLGGGGDDTIRGGAGADELKGGRGKDVLRGRAGNDALLGGAGADQLSGGGGKDRLDGGTGRDSCAGGPGRDRLVRCE